MVEPFEIVTHFIGPYEITTRFRAMRERGGGGGAGGGPPTTPPSAGHGHLRGDHVAWEQGPRRAAPARPGLTRAPLLFDLLRTRAYARC